MSYRVYDCIQYSPEWWQLRRGIPTASNFGRILTPKTQKLSSQADDYICELIADQVQLNPPFFTERNGHTAAMRNGINCEPEARRFYEMEVGLDVRQVGFVTTEDGRFGFSPDGLVGEEGGLELKCPEAKTQARYLIDATLPDEYRAQVHGPLALALIDPTMPFKWWDFMSYCPGLADLTIRVEPDDYTKKLAEALEVFYARYQSLLERLRAEPAEAP